MSEQSMVRYGSFTEDQLQQDSAHADALGGGVFEQIEVGDNVYRFLPPPVGKNSPFRVTAMHYVDAVPGLPDKVMVFACPRVELKQPCPVCQEAERLSREPSPHSRERAQRLGASLRVYANVINRNKPDAGIRVLSFGKQIFDQLKAIRRNPRLGGDYTNPLDGGFDIIISRTGTGKNDTKYVVSADRSSSPLAPSVERIQELIDGQHDLEKQVNPIVPEELLAVWQETTLRVHGRPLGGPPRVGAQLMQGGEQRQAAQTVQTTGSAVDDADFDEDFN